MSRRDDDLIEQAERAAVLHDEITANAIHRLSQRVLDLEAMKTALLNALTRYRVQHDQSRWSDDRPCDCQSCKQAEQAIAAAKGGAGC